MPFLPIIWNVISGGFLKYWKIIVPVLLVAVALLYVNHLRTQHIKDQNQIQEDTRVLKDWSTKFDNLKDAADEAEKACKAIIDDQNQHVEALAKEADKYKQAAVQASKANTVLKKQYEAKIQDILNAPKPKTDHASIQYLIDFAKNAGVWEEPKHE